MSSYGVSKGVQRRPFVYTTHVLLSRVKTITRNPSGSSDSRSPSLEGLFIEQVIGRIPLPVSYCYLSVYRVTLHTKVIDTRCKPKALVLM